jgi:hypothetical protein
MPAKRKITTTTEAPPVLSLLSQESPFICTGIQEDNPRDFLAALGFLRLLAGFYPESEVAMAWLSDGHPSFSATEALPDDFLERLISGLKDLNARQPHPFVHNKVIKVALPVYWGAVRRSLECDRHAGIPPALFAAYGSQIHDAEKGEVSPSYFSFSNGQGGKELLRDISELIEWELSAPQLLADLKGEATATKDAKSFRWSPVEYRSAAYRAADPGSNVKGDVVLDHPSLNMLAFFGLTFYPVVDRAAREFTCGFSRRKRDRGQADYFTWPVWDTPLSVDTLSSLLLHPALHSEACDPFFLRSLGCQRVLSSQRFRDDKGNLYFFPSSPMF